MAFNFSYICTAISIIGILFSLPTLILQTRALTVPVLVLLVSLFLNNLTLLIDSQLWQSSDFKTWPSGLIICDIETKLLVFLGLTQTGSLACIFRRLNTILDPNAYPLIPTTRQRIHTTIFETTLLVILPSLRLITSWYVSPARFGTFRVVGCINLWQVSWTSTLMVVSWPLIICIIAGIYAALAAYKAWKHHREICRLLGRQGASKSRTQRLFVLAVLLWVTFTPLKALSVVSLWSSEPLPPFSTLHGEDWSENIVLISTFKLSGLTTFLAQAIWSMVVSFCLGCGHDATKIYKSLWTSFRALFSRKHSEKRRTRDISWQNDVEAHRELVDTGLVHQARVVSELESIGHVLRS